MSIIHILILPLIYGMNKTKQNKYFLEILQKQTTKETTEKNQNQRDV